MNVSLLIIFFSFQVAISFFSNTIILLIPEKKILMLCVVLRILRRRTRARWRRSVRCCSGSSRASSRRTRTRSRECAQVNFKKNHQNILIRCNLGSLTSHSNIANAIANWSSNRFNICDQTA